VRTEDLKQTILKMFRGHDFYGYEVKKKLAHEGIEVHLSRLYRVLNSMFKEELLETRWEKSSIGPMKRMYKLSKKGEKSSTEYYWTPLRPFTASMGNIYRTLGPKSTFSTELSDSLRII